MNRFEKLKSLTDPQEAKQFIFDETIAHLKRQGRCADETGCLYRKDGKRCAAGLWITDENYRPALENAGAVWAFEVSQALSKSGVPPHALDLLTELQVLHDIWLGTPDEKARTQHIASRCDPKEPT